MKTKKDNRFVWSGVAGGLSTLLVYFAGGNLPIALASGAVLFGAGSLLFKKPKAAPEIVLKETDDSSLLEKGKDGVSSMHELAAAIEDDTIRKNADEVVELCDTIITMVTDDVQKLRKSSKLFTYYIPTINKTLDIYRKLESSDTDRHAFDTTIRFLDDCENGLKRHIENLSSADLTDMAIEMETMTNVMNIDGLVNRMKDTAISLDQK